MNTKLRKALLAVSVVGMLALVGHAASANIISVTGIAFRTDVGSKASSFNVVNSGGGQNIGTSPLDVTGQIAFYTGSPVFVTGGMSFNSRFRAVGINGIGNAGWLGPIMVGQQGFIAANTLNLGTPPAVAGSALVVKATLEPQGFIGVAWQ